MICLATLAPAATADATGFALLKRYLDGREPALPEGCVLDVELEAKELLARFLPAGRAAVEEAYRGMRAELGRRPTPTELLHAHYLPHTLRAAHGSWFGFCRAEGDLDASEERVVERFGAWLGMLETTNLNKSYKMVVLRVLLDRDALWDGLEIPRLAAACRSFLENHPSLRADLPEKWGQYPSASEEPVPFSGELSGDPDRAFTKWWLKWPLSRWMDDQAGPPKITKNPGKESQYQRDIAESRWIAWKRATSRQTLAVHAYRLSSRQRNTYAPLFQAICDRSVAARQADWRSRRLLLRWIAGVSRQTNRRLIASWLPIWVKMAISSIIP
jgi:hypothetical protein